MGTPWSDDLVPPGVPGQSEPPVPSSRPPVFGGRRPTGPVLPPGPETSAGGPSVAMVGLVIVLLAGMLAVPAASITRGAKSFWPKKWDARLGPIAQRDAQIRGLNYDHPVAVHFLSEAAFKKLVGSKSGGPTAADRAEIEREAGTFRALGFIGGKVDLLQVERQADEAGILAFYDFNTKEITVRGTLLNVSLRATLAHELTHVLQDQHFDIRSIEKRAAQADEHTGGSSQAMLALIEGDANNVMSGYLKGLSPAQRAEYGREQAAQGVGFGKATVGVPPFIDAVFSAPYSLGPLTVRVLIAGGGNNAVNAALTGPIPTSADYVEAGLVSPPPPNLVVPAIASGETAVGKPESFGAFELYLMLAARGDGASALTAADAVQGGIARGLRASGRYCYRATLGVRDPTAGRFVAGAIRRWEQGATNASVSQAGTSVTFTACDPGRSAVGPSGAKLTDAEGLLEGRAGITVGAAEKGLPADEARCVGRLFARSPNALALLEQAGLGTLSPEATAALRQQVQGEAATCHDDPGSGLL